MDRDIRKPKLATKLPPPRDVDPDTMRKAVERARPWHDAIIRATSGMESRTDSDVPVRLR